LEKGKIMLVQVFSGDTLVEEKEFSIEDENMAIKFADWWQDNGYKVRVIEMV
jgi:hypothetical protein